jgi:hypothetical protein
LIYEKNLFQPYELREYPASKFSCVKSEVDNAEDPMAGKYIIILFKTFCLNFNSSWK